MDSFQQTCLVLLLFFCFEFSFAVNACKNKKVDLFVAFATNYLSDAEIAHEVDFVFDILNKVSVSENQTHVSTTTISNNPQLNIKFKQYTDIGALKTMIMRTTKGAQLAYLKDTIHLIRTEGFTKENGGRSQAKRVVLIFMTRPSSDDPTLEAKRLRIEGYYVIVIGIGNAKYIQSLTSNSSYSFTVRSASGLGQIMKSVSDLICEPMELHGKCLPGWVFYNCSCFLRTQEHIPWNWSSALCKLYDTAADVTTIHDQCTFSFLNGNYPRCWIGIKKIVGKTIWWIDNSSFVDEEQHFTYADHKCLNGENRKFYCRSTDVNRKNLSALCSYRLDHCKTFQCDYSKGKVTPFTLNTLTSFTNTESTSAIGYFTSSSNDKLFDITQRVDTKTQNVYLLKIQIRKLRGQLKIDRHTLSHYVRKLTSASDNRASCKGVGVVAAIVIVGVVLLFVLSDVCKFFVNNRSIYAK